MDNITHTLAGVLLAEACCTFAPKSLDAARLRGPALWLSVLCNNFPDFDFAYTRLTPGKLGYLLHHRGHTHTVPGALALAAVALFLVFVWTSLRGVRFAPRQWRFLAALAITGTLLHIAFDFQNNYGVHPFWPLDDRWFYGDAMFIVEPLLWCAAIPPIAFLSKTRLAPVAAALVFIGGLAFGMRSGAVTRAETVRLVVIAALVGLAAWRLSQKGRVSLAILGWVAVTACFVGGAKVAEGSVRRASSLRYPTTRLIDVVRTPSPANPFCWSVITVGVDGSRYVARRSLVSIAPSWFPAGTCRSFDTRTTTAPLTPIHARDSAVYWQSEYATKLDDLNRLASAHCDAAAFLRYARVPFTTGDVPPVIGDLRFDRTRALEFTEIRLTATQCPPHVPPWTPPRQDVLSPL